MGIPESQLTTWSNQGATVTAQATHNSIRAALEAYHHWPEDLKYDVYLQGSYKNSTNIYGNSDVDVVVEMTSVFYSNLEPAEKTQMGLTAGKYSCNEFRQLVINALTAYYGGGLVDTSGSKSIKILPGNGRLKADVVAAVQYHFYQKGRKRAEGITFWTIPGNEQIINYPKLHFDNGANKNSDRRTQGRYKPSTRMFKNARDKIVADHPELAGLFPSYFVECLLYNTLDDHYGITYSSSYTDVVNRLSEKLYSDTANELVCQNGIYYLFGTLPVQWNIADAQKLVGSLISLWNGW